VGEVHIQTVSVEDTWARLKGDAGSVLIDVRTIAEWAYVGLPDLAQIGKRPVLVEWQGFPDDRQNSTFIERVAEALNPLGANREAELFLSVARVPGASRQPRQWRRQAICAAATSRTGSRVPSIPNVIEGDWPAGKLEGFPGFRASRRIVKK
jgi:rhodanese-related sulfurtransferase